MKQLLLLIFLLSSVWIAHQSSIEKIINQKYNDYMDRSESLTERSDIKRVPKMSSWMDTNKHKHHCIHDKIAHNLVGPSIERVQSSLSAVKHNGIRGKRLEKRQTNFAPMRFFIDGKLIDPNNNNDPRACYSEGAEVPFYDQDQQTDITHTCFANETISAELRTTINNLILPTLTTIFNSFLTVETTTGNFKLDSAYYNANTDNRQCYFDVPIPEEYINTGVTNADYIIFVTARPADISTVAYATGCNFQVINGNEIGRPLAGIINFNPAYFLNFTGNSFSEFDFTAAVKVAVHELTHALGFSSVLYQYYRDFDTGETYTPTIDQSTTVSGTSPAGEEFTKELASLSGPRAVGYARNHFGCQGLTNVQLEDIGGAGTAGSHWEKRVVGDELMTGFINKAMPISGLTLSLFEDMGWYRVNYSQAEYWGWGKDQGCPFVEQRCEQSWPNSAKGYWCSESNTAPSCTADYKAKGSCIVQEYDFDLAAYYQHFDDNSRGGTDAGADVCPYYIADVYCGDDTLNSQAQTDIGEVYGSSSRCFEVSNNRVSCYPFVCSNSNNNNGTSDSSLSLKVNISGQLFDCPSAGGQVDVSSVLSGVQITCPSASLLCGITTPQKAGDASTNSDTSAETTNTAVVDTSDDTNFDTNTIDTDFGTDFDTSGFFESFFSLFNGETGPSIAEESGNGAEELGTSLSVLIISLCAALI